MCYLSKDLEDEDSNMQSNRERQDSSGIRSGNQNNFASVKYKIQPKAEKPGRTDVADVKSMMDTRQFFNELKDKKV